MYDVEQRHLTCRTVFIAYYVQNVVEDAAEFKNNKSNIIALYFYTPPLYNGEKWPHLIHIIVRIAINKHNLKF